MRRLAALIVLLFACSFPASAHLTPNSELRIDIGPASARIDVIVPQGEYAYATGYRIGDTPTARRWLTQNLALRSPDGRAWRIDWQTVEFVEIAGPPDLHAIALLTPPPGAPSRRFTIGWTGVIDRVPSHFALVVIGTDFGGGKVGGDPILLGALQGDKRSLTLDRAAPSVWAGLWGAMKLGMHHIAEGHDHLLFLIALLLPAPLTAVVGIRRWNGPRPVGQALRKLTLIVTAFTIGHSLTLIAGAFLGWKLPAQPVEICIALSILISAIHAWRPMFPGREPVIAAGFGLVHGMAFATIVGGLGLGRGEQALSVLGFNIGIELVQIAVVACVMPSLMMLARTDWYPVLRNAGAVLAGGAAVAWIVERVSGDTNPIAEGIDAALGHAPWVVAGLTLLAVPVFLRARNTEPNSQSS